MLIGLLGISACGPTPDNPVFDPPLVTRSPVLAQLHDVGRLDGPPLTIAVYRFSDLTGQRKPSDRVALLSTAVTQGAEVWVIGALREVGKGSWFQVLERVNLDNLVKERQLIRSTREIYAQSTSEGLTPLLFAGLILEGGIVGYDTNVLTGGVGARFLGIGGQVEYRQDRVVVAMRLVSVQTGQILLSVATEKTVFSYAAGAGVFRFVDGGTEPFEFEAGTTLNEPVNHAVRSATEAAVLELVRAGIREGLWSPADGARRNEGG